MKITHSARLAIPEDASAEVCEVDSVDNDGLRVKARLPVNGCFFRRAPRSTPNSKRLLWRIGEVRGKAAATLLLDTAARAQPAVCLGRVRADDKTDHRRSSEDLRQLAAPPQSRAERGAGMLLMMGLADALDRLLEPL